MRETTAAWTDARRRTVAKTLFDLLKIEVAATYASNFFATLPIAAKVALSTLMLVTAVIAFFIHPKKRDEAEE